MRRAARTGDRERRATEVKTSEVECMTLKIRRQLIYRCGSNSRVKWTTRRSLRSQTCSGPFRSGMPPQLRRTE